ncbi:MAG TPA: hypothetical protein VF601_04210 [Beijerinckiaceae bacterium]
MINDRALFGENFERHLVDARIARACYLRDCASATRRSPYFKRAAAGIGVATLAFVGLANFAPSQQGTADLPSVSPTELTAALRTLPEAERWDAH